MAEIITPLVKRVLKNGDHKFSFTENHHTVADICRHLHSEGCAEDAIYILSELLASQNKTC